MDDGVDKSVVQLVTFFLVSFRFMILCRTLYQTEDYLVKRNKKGNRIAGFLTFQV